MRRASLSGAAFRTGLIIPVFGHLNALCLPVRLASTAAAAAGSPVVNLYKRLRVDPAASPDELKAAYRRRALECHPDVVDEPHRAQAEVDFRAASEAYDTLMDPTKREEHDRALGLTRTPEGHREAPGASGASGRSAPSGPARRSARRPFVRGDADRMFRAAFDGLSLDEVLFRARQRERATATATATAAGGPEEAMRRVVEAAAERFAERVRRQYGPGAVGRARVRTAARAGPSPPPADAMPFRPFRGWTLPRGVRAPPEPAQGPASHVSAERVVMGEAQAPERRAVPRHFPRVADAGGEGLSFAETLQHMEKRPGVPHNMGQLYSFHRPY